MAKRKPAPKRGTQQAARTKRAETGASRPSRAPAGRTANAPAAAKSSIARSSKGKKTERKAADRPSTAARKVATQKRRATRRPSEAETIQESRRGADPGSVSAGREVQVIRGASSNNETQGQIRKTTLSDKDLAEFRELLLEKRRELVGDMTNMSDEARRVGAPGGTASSMPIHMADLGSDTWEQELTLGLIENERNLLREIDEALERIEKKTYGICVAMNKPIGKARLRFKPWAKYCIEYARKREQGLA